MAPKTLILNFKNYPEVLGDGSVRLAQSARRIKERTGINLIVAPPTPMLGLVVSIVPVPVFSQSASTEKGDKTTGSVLPESVLAAGARGSILNHSESRVPPTLIGALVKRMQVIGLDVCLCARTAMEAGRLARLKTEYLAVEPPELIGSGRAVSKARPEVVTDTVEAVRKAGYGGRVLCGAGIVSGDDARKAVELGAEGILVSSSVVKANDWDLKLGELAGSMD